MNFSHLKPDSWVHHSSQVLGDGLHNELSEYAKTFPTPFNVEKFCFKALKDERTHDLTLKQFVTAFKQTVHERFGNPEGSYRPASGVKENVIYLDAVKDSLKAADNVKDQANLNKISIDDVLSVHAKFHPTFKVTKAKILPAQIMQSWGTLETGQKVNAGISGACALMSAYGTLSAASHTVARDDEGKAHIQWSQVGVALLQATVAAGCGFFAIEALKGHSVY